MAEAAGYVGVVAFGWLVLFQLLLAAGLPLGSLAWGGQHRVLPLPFRLASLASAALVGLGAVTVAQAADLGPALLPVAAIRPLLIGFAVLFSLSFVGNLASQSRLERWHGVPLTALLALSCGVLAIS